MRVAPAIKLTTKERKKLEFIGRGRSSSVRARERASIILLAAEGWENKEIADRLSAGHYHISHNACVGRPRLRTRGLPND